LFSWYDYTTAWGAVQVKLQHILQSILQMNARELPVGKELRHIQGGIIVRRNVMDATGWFPSRRAFILSVQTV
jgi:hypothetical protein